MNSLFSSLGPMARLMAPPSGEGGNPIMSFLPLIAIVAIFYFLILRPQRKKQKDTQNMLSALKKGDRVVTVGGIHGVIQSVRDTTIILKVDDNVKLEFNRGAISGVVSQAREEREEKKIDPPAEKDGDTSETEEKSE